ncbi:MAG: metallophosphoesterase [Patescibacteria group bacterium]|jgi:predicted MPP superfamily phosphohydrolase
MIIFLLSLFYYSFYLLFPLLLFLIWRLYSIKKFSIEIVILFLIVLVLIWSRFIEPNRIIIKDYDLIQNETGNDLKIAVASDLHLGVYRDKAFLKKVIKKIELTNPDIVILPGDFRYQINPKKLDYFFSELKRIKVPKFAVLGNHDYGKGDDNISKEINATLASQGVLVLNNQIRVLEINDTLIRVIGLEDIWTGLPDFSILKDNSDLNYDLNLLIAHNPDTIYEVQEYCLEEGPCLSVDLMVSGHTHAGQIRIPGLYKYIIPSKYNFDRGFYHLFSSDIFVSPGLGNVVLPLRLFNPPEISVINLKY